MLNTLERNSCHILRSSSMSRVPTRPAFGCPKSFLHICLDALGVHMGVTHAQVRTLQHPDTRKAQYDERTGLFMYLNLAITHMDVRYFRNAWSNLCVLLYSYHPDTRPAGRPLAV